jgi:hypothetical protein
MRNDNKTYLIMCLNNAVALICFTILSVVFGKWWIVLFSILFLDYFRKDKKDKS